MENKENKGIKGKCYMYGTEALALAALAGLCIGKALGQVMTSLLDFKEATASCSFL